MFASAPARTGWKWHAVPFSRPDWPVFTKAICGATAFNPYNSLPFIPGTNANTCKNCSRIVGATPTN